MTKPSRSERSRSPAPFLLLLPLLCALSLGALAAPFASAARADAPPTLAPSRQSVFELQRYLEERLTASLRTVDPRAVVFVALEPKTRRRALPLTPFVVERLSIQNPEGEIELEKLDVVAFTRATQLPAATKLLLDQMTAVFKLKPGVRLEALAPPPEDDLVAARLTDLLARLDGWYRSAESAAGSAGNWLAALLVALLVAPLAAIAVAVAGSRRITASVAPSFERIAGALGQVGQQLSEGGGFASASASAGAAAPTARTRSRASLDGDAGDGGRADASSLREFSDDSLLEMLGDCYWTERDGEAAYLWRRVPVEARRRLIGKAPFVGDYAAFLSRVPEIASGLPDDPFYLDPPGAHAFDTAVVTRAVRRHPALLGAISEARSDALDLSAVERIELLRRAAALPRVTGTELRSLLGVGTAAPSPARRIARETALPLRSIEEESEVLGLLDLSPSLSARIFSLGWLLRLPEPEAVAILQRFSARELASAWVGPEQVLDRILALLPEKKGALVRSYAAKTPATRDAPAFLAIHGLAVEALQAATVDAGTLGKESANVGSSNAA